MSRWFAAIVVMSVLIAPRAAPAQEQSAEEEKLAKQLSNPLASLISVPFQNNFDFGIGPNEGWRYTLGPPVRKARRSGGSSSS